jgi:hypothetical protein
MSEKDKLKRIEDYAPKELEQMLREIRSKQLANKGLSPEEKLLWVEYQERVNLIEEQEKIEQEEALSNEEKAKQEDLLKKFDALPEEDKLAASVEGTYLSKSPGKINEFRAKWVMDRVTNKAKKKGGAIIEKGYLDSSIEFIWVKKPKIYVEFFSFDEKGVKVRSIARVTKTKHRLRGTSIPVHIAIEGVSENVNLLEGVNTSLSAQHINQMNMLNYQAGFFDALDAKEQQKKKFDVASIGFILTLIMLAVLLYLAYQQYNLYELVMKMAPQAVAAATGGA